MEVIMVYWDMLLTAFCAVYIVGVSGFTTAWRGALARLLRTDERRLRPLPPFDCSKCATFWACLIVAAVEGLTFGTAAWACALSYLAAPMVQILQALRERVLLTINKIIL